jgi:hypothetical protein
MKVFSSALKNAPAYYNAGAVVVHSGVNPTTSEFGTTKLT